MLTIFSFLLLNSVPKCLSSSKLKLYLSLPSLEISPYSLFLMIFSWLLIFGSPVSVSGQYLSKCILILKSADIFCFTHYPFLHYRLSECLQFSLKLLFQKNASPHYFWNCIISQFLDNFFFSFWKK